jgi:hypothetical protein
MGDRCCEQLVRGSAAGTEFGLATDFQRRDRRAGRRARREKNQWAGSEMTALGGNVAAGALVYAWSLRLRGQKSISMLARSLSPVMAGAGLPFMPFPRPIRQGVDGGPSPAMTMRGRRRLPDDSSISRRALSGARYAAVSGSNTFCSAISAPRSVCSAFRREDIPARAVPVWRRSSEARLTLDRPAYEQSNTPDKGSAHGFAT